MAKAKISYVCQSCGHESPKWLGRCPGCEGWNSFSEERVRPPAGGHARGGLVEGPNRPVRWKDLPGVSEARVISGLEEFDRVLGGGLVPGSVLLLAGDPGIGKSTLLLQVCLRLSGSGQRVFYVSAEESLGQLRLRAERLGTQEENLWFSCETNLAQIQATIEELRPALTVIDSIQMVYRDDLPASAGSIGQVRECATELACLAKRLNLSVCLIGHVTKEGAVAGPRALEHLVDVVLYFEGERFQHFRVLRGVKNRFGTTQELAIFQMTSRGLEEVENPSRFFLSEEARPNPGAAVVATTAGTRTLLVEMQALTTRSLYGTPARRFNGVDFNRVAVLLAVLDKRAGFSLGLEDVFVNVTGGVHIEDPGADLGIAAAVASSLRNTPATRATAFVGEVGLGGEIRSVVNLAARVREAGRLGFQKVVGPAVSSGDLPRPSVGVRYVGAPTLREALRAGLDRPASAKATAGPPTVRQGVGAGSPAPRTGPRETETARIPCAERVPGSPQGEPGRVEVPSTRPDPDRDSLRAGEETASRESES